jgi:protein tyrosine/serine phosphatase
VCREVSANLVWQGCLNVRDVGGCDTRDGRRLRTGVLIRSDNLSRLTAEGQAAVRAAQVSLVMDLRSPFELEIESNPFRDARSPGPAYRNLPLIDQNDEESTSLINLAPTAAKTYQLMLDRCQANIAAILDTAAAAAVQGGPVVVHCHSGKDRTGLIVALALRAAGVDDQDIARDYALSDKNLAARYTEMLDRAPDESARARLAAQLTSKPESILAALDHLDRQYGGTGQYLRACGLGNAVVRRLRKRLRT